MTKTKQNEVYDKEKHDLQKALRIPIAKKGFLLPDKTKYNRKEKYKKDYKS